LPEVSAPHDYEKRLSALRGLQAGRV